MILVTGAAGQAGSRVVRELCRQGRRVRALVRSRAQARALDAIPGVEMVEGDMLHAETLGPVLEGVERALLISSANERLVETQCTFIEAAKKSGLAHVVKFSGKESNVGYDAAKFRFVRMHEEIERHLQHSGLVWTILQPSQFMQVYLREARTIASKGELRLAMEGVRMSPVDLDDVAKVRSCAVAHSEGGAGHGVSMNTQYAIEVRDLTKIYGSGETAYQALKGVDFLASRGEFVMLSGPSGSGKTTLLSILGCVLTPTAGDVKLLGEDISHAKERDLPRLRLSYIGFVFQAHNLIDALSARDNIALLLELRGSSRRDATREAVRLLESVGLADKVDSRPRDLSGGQRQRVAIARALAGSPPIILADEPTAALDAHNGLAVTELLRVLAKEHGHTVVVVTHDSRIFHLADRIIHIEDGLIAEKTS